VRTAPGSSMPCALLGAARPRATLRLPRRTTSPTFTCRPRAAPTCDDGPRSFAPTQQSGRCSCGPACVDEFLDRYAVILHSYQRQTTGRRARSSICRFAAHAAASSSPLEPFRAWSICCPTRESMRQNRSRAARLPSGRSRRRSAREATRRLREREERHFRPTRTLTRAATGRSFDTTDARQRTGPPLANPNAGELLVSAGAGWDFVDHRRPAPFACGITFSLLSGDSNHPPVHVVVDAPNRAHHRRHPRGTLAHSPTPRWLIARRWSSASCRRVGVDDDSCSRAMGLLQIEHFSFRGAGSAA